MGAIVSGPLSNGLNITQACITHTHKSTRGGGGKRKFGEWLTSRGWHWFPQGPHPMGRRTMLGIFPQPRRSSWCQTGMAVLVVWDVSVCPGAGLGMCWGHPPATHVQEGARTYRATGWPPLFFKLEKAFFKKKVLKLKNVGHYQKKKWTYYILGQSVI